MMRWIVSSLIAILIMLMSAGVFVIVTAVGQATWWVLERYPTLYCCGIITIFFIITIFIHHVFTDDDKDDNDRVRFFGSP